MDKKAALFTGTAAFSNLSNIFFLNIFGFLIELVWISSYFFGFVLKFVGFLPDINMWYMELLTFGQKKWHFSQAPHNFPIWWSPATNSIPNAKIKMLIHTSFYTTVVKYFFTLTFFCCAPFTTALNIWSFTK